MIPRTPLPEWLIDKNLTMLQEAIQGYQDALPLLAARCQSIAETDQVNERGIPCDDHGSLTEYRLDAKYCAGQVVRLIRAFRDMTPRAEWEGHRFSLIPTNPRQLAPWAWLNPWKGGAMPEGTLNTLDWKDFFLRFTERERRALVYTIGCGMRHAEAARKMGISVKRLRNILFDARKKFGPNESFLISGRITNQGTSA